MLVLVVLSQVLGCSPAEECEDCAAETEDTAAMVYSTEAPEPLWTAEEFGENLARIQAIGAPNPIDIGDAFVEIMAQGDEDCPGNGNELTTIPAGCDTDDGYHFAGIGWYYANESVTFEDGSTLDLSFSHGGDFEIIRPNGLRFAGGGGMAYITTPEESGLSTSFDIHGSWVDEQRLDWLVTGFSGVFEATVTRGDNGDWSYTATGGMGMGDDHISLTNATWDSTDACEGRMSGSISVRDERGYWTEWQVGDDCDDCGEVVFHEDTDLGEYCMDTTAWGHLLFQLSAPR